VLLEGDFTFTPNENGKKEFFKKDKGVFKLYPYKGKHYAQLKLSVEQMLYPNSGESYKLMAEHSPYVRKQLEKAKKMARNSNISMVFYGKVVDQFGFPIPNVKVKYNYTKVLYITISLREDTTTTDENGCFKIKARGVSIGIDGMGKKGYYKQDFFLNNNFRYSQTLTPFIPDKSRPVVFLLRKKTKAATYLYEHELEIPLKDNETKQYISFIDLKSEWEKKEKARLEKYEKDHEELIAKESKKAWDEYLKYKKQHMNDKQLISKRRHKAYDEIREIERGGKKRYYSDYVKKHFNFEISATFDKKSSYWTVTFKAKGDGCGIILGDEKQLYEAPKRGYKKEFSFKFNETHDSSKVNINNSYDLDCIDFEHSIFYIRTMFAGKYIYSYVKFLSSGGPSIREDGIRIYINTITNPFGDRSFEEMKIPNNFYYIKGYVYKEFFKGVLPKKPNLKKMFVEFRKLYKCFKTCSGGSIWRKIDKNNNTKQKLIFE
jgi:hypothetical protein